MPNWVQNKLTFRNCTEEKRKEIINFVKSRTGEIDSASGDVVAMDFENIVPMPENIYRGSLGTKERELYGENNWYDWSCKNWGTKWNASDTGCDGETVYFTTAWSCPFPIYEALSKKFPSVNIRVEFADEDMGQNCGRFVLKNGEEVSTFFPEGGTREAVRFACDVWGYDFEEYYNEYCKD